MSQIILVQAKLKNKRNWLDWCKTLKKRKKEVLQTLKDESVTTEACFLAPDKKSVYYFMRAKNLARAKIIAQKNIHKIDKEHKLHRKKSLGNMIILEELFHFEMP
ncbi:MAG: DUF6176 family protein [Candidatus Woesearchaeota archaeon]|nr:DUF6176 family protein [Candidatus Woesearchaeota archaeon]